MINTFINNLNQSNQVKDKDVDDVSTSTSTSTSNTSINNIGGPNVVDDKDTHKDTIDHQQQPYVAYQDNLKRWHNKKRVRTSELMHVDNIYREHPPNFKLLADKYPEFGKLLNYLLWLNDTLIELGIQQQRNDKDKNKNKAKGERDAPSSSSLPQIRALDIGTGASCIYPLLGVRQLGWSFVATEVDKDSVVCARKNVETNKLEQMIEVRQVNDVNSILVGVVASDNGETFDVSMCNPPFFDSLDQTKLNPKTVCTGSDSELVTEGGELEFVKKMIQDSLFLRTRIRAYSTLLGRKKNLKLVVKDLQANNIKTIRTTELTQGKCSRWAVLWTLENEQLLLQKRVDQSAKVDKPVTLTRKQKRALARPGVNETFISKQSLNDLMALMGEYVKQSLGINVEQIVDNNTLVCTVNNIDWMKATGANTLDDATTTTTLVNNDVSNTLSNFKFTLSLNNNNKDHSSSFTMDAKADLQHSNITHPEHIRHLFLNILSFISSK
ncbi:hypothetical protein SAMD00019534_019820 [Acytostelium subglobosum LB1]|uniref:hypothetical protein n=1 Tax=Acytostelium subglobosum LB1 TaxID=1410327 RepID=UPI0006450FA7|nr:hypothetical protein SAMD00019534_019820 [Acytostelium subglobosum LB1]GAM18807.1 hypothetical protein SAMD00019534_019820 [Acytostelium subglobosum LB1]|eukprot:XP_012758027.1 hypothetical protein SAMD00019534_019820 [Acytostelium subglobosum LB1]